MEDVVANYYQNAHHDEHTHRTFQMLFHDLSSGNETLDKVQLKLVYYIYNNLSIARYILVYLRNEIHSAH